MTAGLLPPPVSLWHWYRFCCCCCWHYSVVFVFQIWQEAGCVLCHCHAERLQQCCGFRSILACFHCALLHNGHGSDCLLHRFVCTRYVLFFLFQDTVTSDLYPPLHWLHVLLLLFCCWCLWTPTGGQKKTMSPQLYYTGIYNYISKCTSSKHSVFSPGSEILVGSSRVVFSSMCLPCTWVIGTMLLPGVAYLVRNWRHLSLTMAVPGLACIPLWW